MGMRFSLDLYRNRYLANDFCVIHRVISFFFVGGNMENKKELLKYMIFAGVMGIVVGGIDTVFGKGLILIGEIRNKYFWYLIPFYQLQE